MDRTKTITWNPYTAGYFKNPYPHLKECRETNPIHKGAQGAWTFFSYSDISKIIRSSKFSVFSLSSYLQEKEPLIFEKSTACPYLAKGTILWPMYLNGAEHKHTRVIMGKAFKEIDMKVIIPESLNELFRHFKGAKELDLENFCTYFIYLVTKRMYDISNYEDYIKLKEYSNKLARSQDLYIPKQVYEEINNWLHWGKKILAVSDYRTTIEDFTKELNVNYSEDEINSLMAISVMATFESSKDNLTMALCEILGDRNLIDATLVCNPKELDILIEELFRFTSPLQFTVRINQEPLEYGDIKIPEGSKLYLCLASANRDPIEFSDPDKVIHDRASNNHLAFGAGVHSCLGAQIARQEMRLCLIPMINFLKNYSLVHPHSIKWSKQIFMRTMEHCPLVSVSEN